jgi:hypothetical protein
MYKRQLNWSHARDATSERDLQTAAGASRSMMDQLATMKRPLEDNIPTSGNSLFSKSIILFDGEMFTLVPIGSVLYLPPELRNRILSQPQGDFTFWPNFLKRNTAWLGTKEVPLKMAQGDEKLAVNVLQEVKGGKKLLVSVYKDCPITVLEKPSPAKR